MRHPLTAGGAAAAAGFVGLATAYASNYGNPGGASDGYPPGGSSMSSPEPACSMQGTTTIFVTVPAASSSSTSDSSGEDASDSLSSTQDPSATGDAASMSTFDPSDTGTYVKPFTTITIDLWGTSTDVSDTPTGMTTAKSGAPPSYTDGSGESGSDTGTDSYPDSDSSTGADMGPSTQTGSGVGTDSSSGPSPTADNDTASGYGGASESQPTPSTGAETSADSGATTTSNGPSSPANNPYDSGNIASQPQATSALADAPGSAWLTVVTDSAVLWTNGVSGPTPITQVSALTLTLAGGSASSASSTGISQSSSCITMLGPDGRPTIIEMSAGPLPTESMTPLADSASITAAAMSATSTAAAVGMTQMTATPSLAYTTPNGSPVESGASAQITCTSLTVTGANGYPTVVESTWTVEGGGASIPTDDSGSSNPSVTGTATIQGASPTAYTTCTSFTIVGPDGHATVVHTTWTVSPASATDVPSIPQQQPNWSDSNLPSPSGGWGSVLPSNTLATSLMSGPETPLCTTYTVLGSDGNPTVIEATYSPFEGTSGINANTGGPFTQPLPTPSGNTDSTGSITQPWQSYPSGSGIQDAGTIATCTTYTIIGSNGQPTVVETTLHEQNPTATSLDAAATTRGNVPFSSSFPTPVNIGESSVQSGNQESTVTCITYTVIGTDGQPTVVETTLTALGTDAFASTTGVGYPSFNPTATMMNVPQGTESVAGVGVGEITTCITILSIGNDGQTTPIVETVTIPTPPSGSVTLSTTASQEAGSAVENTATPFPVSSLSIQIPPLSQADQPSLSAYGAGPEYITSGSGFSSGLVATGSRDTIVVGTLTMTQTVMANPDGLPLTSIETDSSIPAYADDESGESSMTAGSPWSSQGDITLWPTATSNVPVSPAAAPAYAMNTMSPETTLQTSTWMDVISEQTTTYTFDFPLTTMAVFTAPLPFSPLRRALRRQDSPLLSSPWSNFSSPTSTAFQENTSLLASLSSAVSVGLPSTTPSIAPSMNGTVAGQMPTTGPLCPTGGKIGNSTLTFDDDVPGPLLNPTQDMWFSSGFYVVPPNVDSKLTYLPSSGGQLIEFVPPALSPGAPPTSGDTAEIGVGSNEAIPCFRFNLYAASLGCDAESIEGWCEFDVTAYRYDQTLTAEQSIVWSETKRVPACAGPSAPLSGGCPLTKVAFDGYNLSSVLITLRVGLDLRVWWGDDFEVGWTDNSCVAAGCRSGAPTPASKRSALGWNFRRSV